MFNRKREITETEKTEIILSYLQDELIILCQNHDPHPDVEPRISNAIAHLNVLIDHQSRKLKHLRAPRFEK